MRGFAAGALAGSFQDGVMSGDRGHDRHAGKSERLLGSLDCGSQPKAPPLDFLNRNCSDGLGSWFSVP